MATGASTADLAVILIDARKGVLTQTRRHSYHRVAARHPPRRARGQQDRPRRLSPRTSSTRIVADYRAFAAQTRLHVDRRRSRCRRCYGDNVIDAARRHALVSRARRCSSTSRRSTIDDDCARPAVPLAGAVGEPARTSTSAASPAPIASRRGRAGRRGASSLPSGTPSTRRRASSPATATCERAQRRPGGDADARPTRSTSRAATCSPPPTRRPQVADQFAAHARLDGRRAAAARPLLPA